MLFRQTAGLIIGLALSLAVSADRPASHLLLETSKGEILIELNAQRAPLTVEAILDHAESGHYDGLIFHRVVEDFVIQTGGYDPELEKRESDVQVVNESGNGLSNQRGTVGLARGEAPHSGSAQFYINLDDNSRLDPRSSRWGYTVFGRVVAGMEAVDAIASVETEPRGELESHVPKEAVLLHTAQTMQTGQALEWLNQFDKESTQ